MSKDTSIHTTIDNIFRLEYARTISFLTAKFGTQHIDTIEDAVQEALYKAMQIWSYQDMPKAPGKWLYKVAYNLVIDNLRRAKKSVPLNPAVADGLMWDNNLENPEQIEDEQLKMIFACCHPSMKQSEQLMLSLKLLCGFSNSEIARAMLKEKEAVKKGITRAKQKFKTEVGHLTLPAESQCKIRLQAVLKVIYLLFNNGYTAYSGDQVLKKDVCEDALRLASMLYKKEEYSLPETKALLALLCFNFSRFDARIGEQGNLLTMEQQDWTLWNKQLIQIGLKFMNESATGDQLSNYHLEAAIACKYSTATSFATIEWEAILEYYDLLIAKQNNPTMALNRLVILEKVKGPTIAFKEFNQLELKYFSTNHIYYAIKADMEKKLGKAAYKKSLQLAISLTSNLKEKEFLREKM